MSASAFILHKGDPHRAVIKGNCQAFLDRLPEGKSWMIEVREYHKPRSLDQNAYLWGVCYATLQQATGQDAEDWHEFFLGEHFGWEERELFGKRRLKPIRRSSKLTTAEFADYVAFIQQRAAENGIYIQNPGEMQCAA